MSERKVIVGLRFHAMLPDDDDKAEQVVDRIGNAIVETLREHFADNAYMYSVPGVVAAESFEMCGWSDEAVTLA